MFTIIPLIIIIISLGVILVIAARHMPNVVNLEVNEIPEEREARLKSAILEQRLFRKIYNIFNKINFLALPIFGFFNKIYQKGYTRLKILERFYKFHSASPLPDSAEKNDLRIQELSEKAGQALLDGDFKSAEANYLSLIKINPHQPEGFEGLGRTYLKMGEWEQAEETFTHVTKHWPERDFGFAALAQTAEDKGDWEEAKDLYLHALSINNQPVDYHFNLARVYKELKDNDKAMSSLQKAQTLEPNNPRVLDQLLEVSIILKNKTLAQEVLEKIETVNPDHGKLDELEKKVKGL